MRIFLRDGWMDISYCVLWTLDLSQEEGKRSGLLEEVNLIMHSS